MLGAGYWILDAGFLMLVEAVRRSRFSGDIPQFAESEFHKHPGFFILLQN